MNIIFATKNNGKLKEINAIMKDTEYNIVSLSDAGIDVDVVEDGETFEENAIKKAEEIMRLSGKTVMADDSGLEVDYLDKQPGVYSARFLGEDTPYSIKNAKIIEMLANAKGIERSARFVSVIACAMPNKKTIFTKATIEGTISYEPKGENGFGYDPVFFVSEYGKTMAELPLDIKNNISHRGKALRQMKELLCKE